ncbi:MAG: 50S ribosomal protein L4 [Thermomicrobiales bacterium]
MKVTVYDTKAAEVGSEELDDAIFMIEPNVPIMHQAHVRQEANRRLGTHDTKTRAQVRGGGRKPWRQKGTGRARHGSSRSPIWRTGGVVFGPHPRSYVKKMPKKMRRLAIRSALSAKAANDQVVVVSGLEGLEPKTKAMRTLLQELPANERRTLIVIGKEGNWQSVYRAAGNLEYVKIIRAGYVNVHDVLTHERVLLTTEALETIHELWGAD